MERETFTVNNVIEQSRKYIPLKLDAEKEGASLAKKLKVSAFPTFVVLDKEGVELGRIVGYRTAPIFYNLVEAELSGKRGVDLVLKHLKQFPNDARALTKLAEIESSKGNVDRAKSLVRDLMSRGHQGTEMASVCCQVAQLVGSTDPAFVRSALEYAIKLKDRNTLSVAYEQLMTFAAMNGNVALMRSTAHQMMGETDINPTLYKKAERVAKGPTQSATMSTPEGLIRELRKQISAIPGRDPFYFENLFHENGSLAYLVNIGDSTGRVVVTIQTFLSSLGIDDYGTIYEFDQPGINRTGRMCTAVVGYRSTSIGKSKERLQSEGVLSLLMVLDGDQWRIQSAAFEPKSGKSSK